MECFGRTTEAWAACLQRVKILDVLSLNSQDPHYVLWTLYEDLNGKLLKHTYITDVYLFEWCVLMHWVFSMERFALYKSHPVLFTHACMPIHWDTYTTTHRNNAHTDRQTNTDRQTDRQTDRHTHTLSLSLPHSLSQMPTGTHMRYLRCPLHTWWSWSSYTFHQWKDIWHSPLASDGWTQWNELHSLQSEKVPTSVNCKFPHQ